MRKIINLLQTVSQYLDTTFDTGGDSLFKRNIQWAAIMYMITLFSQLAYGLRYFSGSLPPILFPVILVSIPVLLCGFYLLVVKKRHWLAITILVIYLTIRLNIMMSTYLSGLPVLNAAFIHIAAFGLVFMLGTKKSIIPIFIFSGTLIFQVYLSVNNGTGEASGLSRFFQFITIHALVLFFAYYNEWSMAKAFRERDQAREQEKKNAEAYATRVEKLLENKTQLLADVSHELRTPLSVLKANIEAMEDGINQREESYPVIHRKLHQIDRLIQDIYFISKSDIQQLTLYVEPVLLSELTDELMSSFRRLAKEKGLQLNMNHTLTNDDSNDMTIEGDWQRLIQLFGNLLQNSLDYTDCGGKINLSALAVRSGIEVTVQDSAPGVPKLEHSKLFERLYRKESSRNRATGGSGLGLSICKAIIEAHHGTIAIASSPLGGLAITSWLPLTQPTKIVTPLKQN